MKKLVYLLIGLALISCSSKEKKKEPLSFDKKGAVLSEKDKKKKASKKDKDADEKSAETAANGTDAPKERADAELAEAADEKDGKKKKGDKKAKNGKDKKAKTAKHKGKKQIKRELGSLWHDGSKWNRLFSFSSHRKEGDILFVKVTPSLVEAITRKLQKSFKDQKDDIAYLDSLMVKARIDKAKDGLYTIKTAQVVNFGKKEKDVKIEGQVREQEIDAQGRVTASQLAEVKISVGDDKKAKEGDKEKKDGEKEPEKSELTKGEKKKKKKSGEKTVASRSPERKQLKQKVKSEFEQLKKRKVAKKPKGEEKDAKN